jgi:hypothetical protein
MLLFPFLPQLGKSKADHFARDLHSLRDQLVKNLKDAKTPEDKDKRMAILYAHDQKYADLDKSGWTKQQKEKQSNYDKEALARLRAAHEKKKRDKTRGTTHKKGQGKASKRSTLKTDVESDVGPPVSRQRIRSRSEVAQGDTTEESNQLVGYARDALGRDDNPGADTVQKGWPMIPTEGYEGGQGVIYEHVANMLNAIQRIKNSGYWRPFYDAVIDYVGPYDLVLNEQGRIESRSDTHKGEINPETLVDGMMAGGIPVKAIQTNKAKKKEDKVFRYELDLEGDDAAETIKRSFIENLGRGLFGIAGGPGRQPRSERMQHNGVSGKAVARLYTVTRFFDHFVMGTQDQLLANNRLKRENKFNREYTVRIMRHFGMTGDDVRKEGPVTRGLVGYLDRERNIIDLHYEGIVLLKRAFEYYSNNSEEMKKLDERLKPLGMFVNQRGVWFKSHPGEDIHSTIDYLSSTDLRRLDQEMKAFLKGNRNLAHPSKKSYYHNYGWRLQHNVRQRAPEPRRTAAPPGRRQEPERTEVPSKVQIPTLRPDEQSKRDARIVELEKKIVDLNNKRIRERDKAEHDKKVTALQEQLEKEKAKSAAESRLVAQERAKAKRDQESRLQQQRLREAKAKAELAEREAKAEALRKKNEIELRRQKQRGSQVFQDRMKVIVNNVDETRKDYLALQKKRADTPEPKTPAAKKESLAIAKAHRKAQAEYYRSYAMWISEIAPAEDRISLANGLWHEVNTDKFFHTNHEVGIPFREWIRPILNRICKNAKAEMSGNRIDPIKWVIVPYKSAVTMLEEEKAEEAARKIQEAADKAKEAAEKAKEDYTKAVAKAERLERELAQKKKNKAKAKLERDAREQAVAKAREEERQKAAEELKAEREQEAHKTRMQAIKDETARINAQAEQDRREAKRIAAKTAALAATRERERLERENAALKATAKERAKLQLAQEELAKTKAKQESAEAEAERLRKETEKAHADAVQREKESDEKHKEEAARKERKKEAKKERKKKEEEAAKLIQDVIDAKKKAKKEAKKQAKKEELKVATEQLIKRRAEKKQAKKDEKIAARRKAKEERKKRRVLELGQKAALELAAMEKAELQEALRLQTEKAAAESARLIKEAEERRDAETAARLKEEQRLRDEKAKRKADEKAERRRAKTAREDEAQRLALSATPKPSPTPDPMIAAMRKTLMDFWKTYITYDMAEQIAQTYPYYVDKVDDKLYISDALKKTDNIPALGKALEDMQRVYAVATAPTPSPKPSPSAEPSPSPSAEPTAEASAEPTAEPTAEATASATSSPTRTPYIPQVRATAEPTLPEVVQAAVQATPEPEATAEPTAEPGFYEPKSRETQDSLYTLELWEKYTLPQQKSIYEFIRGYFTHDNMPLRMILDHIYVNEGGRAKVEPLVAKWDLAHPKTPKPTKTAVATATPTATPEAPATAEPSPEPSPEATPEAPAPGPELGHAVPEDVRKIITMPESKPIEDRTQEEELEVRMNAQFSPTQLRNFVEWTKTYFPDIYEPGIFKMYGDRLRVKKDTFKDATMLFIRGIHEFHGEDDDVDRDRPGEAQLIEDKITPYSRYLLPALMKWLKKKEVSFFTDIDSANELDQKKAFYASRVTMDADGHLHIKGTGPEARDLYTLIIQNLAAINAMAELPPLVKHETLMTTPENATAAANETTPISAPEAKHLAARAAGNQTRGNTTRRTDDFFQGARRNLTYGGGQRNVTKTHEAPEQAARGIITPKPESSLNPSKSLVEETIFNRHTVPELDKFVTWINAQAEHRGRIVRSNKTGRYNWRYQDAQILLNLYDKWPGSNFPRTQEAAPDTEKGRLYNVATATDQALKALEGTSTFSGSPQIPEGGGRTPSLNQTVKQIVNQTRKPPPGHTVAPLAPPPDPHETHFMLPESVFSQVRKLNITLPQMLKYMDERGMPGLAKSQEGKWYYQPTQLQNLAKAAAELSGTNYTDFYEIEPRKVLDHRNIEHQPRTVHVGDVINLQSGRRGSSASTYFDPHATGEAAESGAAARQVQWTKADYDRFMAHNPSNEEKIIAANVEKLENNLYQIRPGMPYYTAACELLDRLVGPRNMKVDTGGIWQYRKVQWAPPPPENENNETATNITKPEDYEESRWERMTTIELIEFCEANPDFASHLYARAALAGVAIYANHDDRPYYFWQLLRQYPEAQRELEAIRADKGGDSVVVYDPHVKMIEVVPRTLYEVQRMVAGITPEEASKLQLWCWEHDIPVTFTDSKSLLMSKASASGAHPLLIGHKEPEERFAVDIHYKQKALSRFKPKTVQDVADGITQGMQILGIGNRKEAEDYDFKSDPLLILRSGGIDGTFAPDIFDDSLPEDDQISYLRDRYVLDAEKIKYLGMQERKTVPTYRVLSANEKALRAKESDQVRADEGIQQKLGHTRRYDAGTGELKEEGTGINGLLESMRWNDEREIEKWFNEHGVEGITLDTNGHLTGHKHLPYREADLLKVVELLPQFEAWLKNPDTRRNNLMPDTTTIEEIQDLLAEFAPVTYERIMQQFKSLGPVIEGMKRTHRQDRPYWKDALRDYKFRFNVNPEFWPQFVEALHRTRRDSKEMAQIDMSEMWQKLSQYIGTDSPAKAAQASNAWLDEYNRYVDIAPGHAGEPDRAILRDDTPSDVGAATATFKKRFEMPILNQIDRVREDAKLYAHLHGWDPMVLHNFKWYIQKMNQDYPGLNLPLPDKTFPSSGLAQAGDVPELMYVTGASDTGQIKDLIRYIEAVQAYCAKELPSALVRIGVHPDRTELSRVGFPTSAKAANKVETEYKTRVERWKSEKLPEPLEGGLDDAKMLWFKMFGNVNEPPQGQDLTTRMGLPPSMEAAEGVFNDDGTYKPHMYLLIMGLLPSIVDAFRGHSDSVMQQVFRDAEAANKMAQDLMAQGLKSTETLQALPSENMGTRIADEVETEQFDEATNKTTTTKSKSPFFLDPYRYRNDMTLILSPRQLERTIQLADKRVNARLRPDQLGMDTGQTTDAMLTLPTEDALRVCFYQMHRKGSLPTNAVWDQDFADWIVKLGPDKDLSGYRRQLTKVTVGEERKSTNAASPEIKISGLRRIVEVMYSKASEGEGKKLRGKYESWLHANPEHNPRGGFIPRVRGPMADSAAFNETWLRSDPANITGTSKEDIERTSGNITDPAERTGPFIPLTNQTEPLGGDSEDNATLPVELRDRNQTTTNQTDGEWLEADAGVQETATPSPPPSPTPGQSVVPGRRIPPSTQTPVPGPKRVHDDRVQPGGGYQPFNLTGMETEQEPAAAPGDTFQRTDGTTDEGFASTEERIRGRVYGRGSQGGDMGSWRGGQTPGPTATPPYSNVPQMGGPQVLRGGQQPAWSGNMPMHQQPQFTGQSAWLNQTPLDLPKRDQWVKPEPLRAEPRVERQQPAQFTPPPKATAAAVASRTPMPTASPSPEPSLASTVLGGTGGSTFRIASDQEEQAAHEARGRAGISQADSKGAFTGQTVESTAQQTGKGTQPGLGASTTSSAGGGTVAGKPDGSLSDEQQLWKLINWLGEKSTHTLEDLEELINKPSASRALLKDANKMATEVPWFASLIAHKKNEGK